MRTSTLLAVLAAAAGTLAPAAIAQTPPAVTSFGNAPGTLRLPEALAVAPDGTVLVGDHFSGRIQTFRDGRPVGDGLGLRGDVCGRFGAVSGVARARDGRVYVLDADNQRVHVFGPDGRLVRCFGGDGIEVGRLRTGSGGYAASTASGGIAVDREHVYVADTNNNRIQRFTLAGGAPRVLAKGRVRQPQGLAVRGRRLLVADDGNHRIVELTTSGRFVRATRNRPGFRLRFPYDVALAPNGHAYVADNTGHRVVELDRRLRKVRAWGGFGRAPGRFVFPRAIAVGPRGDVFVADAANDRVSQFTARGRHVRTIGRNGRATGSISAPADVAVSATGEVAVADQNSRVAWFDLGGRWLGRWAQGKSFEFSTATVVSPRSLAFPSAGRLRVVDGGTVRQLGAGEARDLFGDGGAGPGALRARAVDHHAATATTWMLTGTGEVTRLGADGRPSVPVGERDPQDRASTDLAVLAGGTIAVLEGAAEDRPRPADGIVRVYDPAGSRRIATWALPRPAGGAASKPSGIAADGAGGAWVSDAANGRVVRFSAAGAIVATLGAPGTGAGQLAVPAGLAVDCDGGLLVADAGNNRVVRFAGVTAATGCAPRTGAALAAARLPRPLGLRVRTRTRPRRPARRLATFAAPCARACTLRAEAVVGLLRPGRAGRRPATVSVRGSRIAVTVDAATVRVMRSALRSGRGRVTVGVIVRATGRDGVVDTDTATVTFR